jgi:large subunit ribosomal protein L13
MSTQAAKKIEVQKNWFVVDLNDVVLGRAAAQIAHVLRGKHKPIYTPHVDTGDFVVVLNADKVRLTGTKLANKMYHRHTGYPGGLKSINAEKLLASKPEELIKKAVKGMLPKNKLGRQMFKKLKVYAGAQHPHAAQQPKSMEIKD